MDLQAVAASTAQRIGVVQAGLDWLAAQGQVTVVKKENDTWQLAPGTAQAPAGDAARVWNRLNAMLTESAAYRAYFRRAPLEPLLSELAIVRGEGPRA